jgi:hypothetical protein
MAVALDRSPPLTNAIPLILKGARRGLNSVSAVLPSIRYV